MSKRLFMMMAVTLMVASAAMAQGGKFVINGKLTGADGEKVFLSYGGMKDMKTDSTVVKNGKFHLEGMLDAPYKDAVLIMGDMNDMRNQRYKQFGLEPVKITIEGDAARLREAVIHGGKTQEEANALLASYKEASDKLNELNNAYDAAENLDEKEKIREQMEPYSKVVADKKKEFYMTHPDSYLSPHYLRFDLGSMKYDEIKSIYDSFTDNVKRYGGESVSAIEKELKTLSRIQPGEMAPDFSKTDVNGKMFRLSDLRGKVVILDFWASWCKPCRASNPHMKALYEKYHDKGLELVYSASDDGAEAKWRKAIEEDQLIGEGYHHVLRGYDRRLQGKENPNDNSLLYGVHFLPTKYLIDREGKIVGKMTDEELDAKLKEIFGF